MKMNYAARVTQIRTTNKDDIDQNPATARDWLFSVMRAGYAFYGNNKKVKFYVHEDQALFWNKGLNDPKCRFEFPQEYADALCIKYGIKDPVGVEDACTAMEALISEVTA